MSVKTIVRIDIKTAPFSQDVFLHSKKLPLHLSSYFDPPPSTIGPLSEPRSLSSFFFPPPGKEPEREYFSVRGFPPIVRDVAGPFFFCYPYFVRVRAIYKHPRWHRWGCDICFTGLGFSGSKVRMSSLLARCIYRVVFPSCWIVQVPGSVHFKIYFECLLSLEDSVSNRMSWHSIRNVSLTYFLVRSYFAPFFWEL